MNRATCDNDLLAACADFSGHVALGCKIVATGLVIAVLWYGVVFARANGWL
ncbi:hypothetical protein [Paraburkholderia agricolaris]|uniref:hypothetical protein n=1 Tax=Paraburkholderia agricolaris TaxID=2152888 RepID=UPI001291AC6A|nr:hypothetical protein [Paraburkholderia agricolaris]